MIDCKKFIIVTCFSLIIPMGLWAEAPVVDDSDNFALLDEQMESSSAARPKYDHAQIEDAEFDSERRNKFQMNNAQDDDGPALAKDDQNAPSTQNNLNNGATLIDKIQGLQQEIQELRGQLEVQAHDLKLLQQQQLSFYKDLDARLGSGVASAKTPATMSIGERPSPSPSTSANSPKQITKKSNAAAVLPVSRANPADEQIGYLAAYELIKNKQYDQAITAMDHFVQKYPQGGYAANAQYWLGELYMIKKDYANAINHFELVLHQFPSSSKSAASMLKVGYAYAASGNVQEAKKRLEQVVKTYPGTPTAQLANLKLESISAL